VRLDNANNAYIGGGTASKNFPTTVGAFDRTLNNISDGWVMKIKP
jgi:hypothetical protein